MESNLMNTLVSLLSEGEDVAVVTIVRSLGSTPRSPGAKMLVLADGRTFGSIGGGCGEADAVRGALELLDQKKHGRLRLEMTSDLAAGDGMICGGVMEIFVDWIQHTDEGNQEILAACRDSLAGSGNIVLATVTGPDDGALLGQKMLFLPGGREVGSLGAPDVTEQARCLAAGTGAQIKPRLVEVSGEAGNKVEVFLEPSVVAPHLLILGAGHISRPLVKLASILGYTTTVVDDRPAFANTARFPEATQVVCRYFEQFLENAEVGPGTFVVIVTRGHQHDLECLREMIGKPASYIGMIGSRRKVRAVFDQLAAEGVPADRLKEVHSPIGLKIGSETPEEIALSILAEVVQVWRRPGV